VRQFARRLLLIAGLALCFAFDFVFGLVLTSAPARAGQFYT